MLEIMSEVVVVTLFFFSTLIAVGNHGKTRYVDTNGPSVTLGIMITAGLFWLGGAYDAGPSKATLCLLCWQGILGGTALGRAAAGPYVSTYNGWLSLLNLSIMLSLLTWAGFWN